MNAPEFETVAEPFAPGLKQLDRGIFAVLKANAKNHYPKIASFPRGAKGPNSPWGKVQQRTQWDRGIAWVGTAGHGGLLIAKGLAEKILTPAAIKCGTPWAGYLAYEEDCQYAVAVFDLLGKGLYPQLTEQFGSKENPEPKDNLWKIISRWYPEYLEGRGIAPEPVAHAAWKHSQTLEIARNANSPDLIVSALRNAQDATLTDVFTADGKKHIVGGYDCSNPWLSKCQIVESPTYPVGPGPNALATA